MKMPRWGWSDDFKKFVVGRRTYGGAAYTDSTNPNRGKYLWPYPGGSVEGWSAAVTPLLAQGCDAHTVAILSAFASPLMALFPEPNPSCLLSLIGEPVPAALAQDAMFSVWGRKEALTIPRITMYKERLQYCERNGNLPTFFEELALRDQQTISKVIDNYAHAPEGHWAGIGLATSHSPLIKTKLLSGAPWYLGVVEYRITTPKPIMALSDRIRREAMANAGHAGDLYASWLVIPASRPAIVEMLDEAVQEVGARLPPAHRPRVMWAAAVMTAARIVTHLDLLELSVERVRQTVLKPLRAKTAGAPIPRRQSAPSERPERPSCASPS